VAASENLELAECTTSLVAPCGRKGWSRETRLAFISPHLFDPAQRVWDRHKGATGTATARGYSHDDEHLHQSGARTSPRSKQQGRPASFAYGYVRHPLMCSLLFPRANANSSEKTSYGGSVLESNPRNIRIARPSVPKLYPTTAVRAVPATRSNTQNQ